ncbi:MAG: hypothetical protein LBT04_02070 [Prevotellaceae bacterium]|jgi:hypothetical protein|nr:hypothetical protein [Prevotellaceae bacterium]
MKKEDLKGVVTPEQITLWKNLHGEIFSVQVDGSICYLKKPDRSTFKAIASIGQSDPVRANEVLLNDCWLGGDETIKTDDEKFFGVSSQIAGLIEIKQAELKKL